MRAISIRQPWAWAVCYLGKRIENREWRSSPGLLAQAYACVGRPLLLHAGLGCTRSEYAEAVRRMCNLGLASVLGAEARPSVPPLVLLPRGALVGRAVLRDVVETDEQGHTLDLDCFRCLRCGALSGSALTGPARECPKLDPWAARGAIGLALEEVETLANPIAATGALGLFNVPDELISGLAFTRVA